MQKTVYLCDSCERQIDHFTVQYVTKDGPLHFCSLSCARDWYAVQLTKEWEAASLASNDPNKAVSVGLTFEEANS